MSSDEFENDEPEIGPTPPGVPPGPPARQPSIQDILMAMAQKIDQIGKEQSEIKDKVKHFDQFREDTLAQIDTISNAMHESKLGGSQQGEGAGQAGPPAGIQFDPNAVKGAVEAINGLVTNAFDMIYKWKMGTLADPMDQKRYEYGDRVLRRIANEEIGHVKTEVKAPAQALAENKYAKMFVTGHGNKQNLR